MLADGRHGNLWFLYEAQIKVVAGLLDNKCAVSKRILKIKRIQHEDGRIKAAHGAKSVENAERVFGRVVEIPGQARQAGNGIQGGELEPERVSGRGGDVESRGAIANQE